MRAPMPGRERDHLLAVAGIAEQGVDVSLRDIARRAGEGLWPAPA